MSLDFDAVVIGAGFGGMYVLQAQAEAFQGTGLRDRQGRKQVLVLEPLRGLRRRLTLLSERRKSVR